MVSEFQASLKQRYVVAVYFGFVSGFSLLNWDADDKSDSAPSGIGWKSRNNPLSTY